MGKLQGKDLITVGIFTAIYLVIITAISMLGFIPIFLVLLIVLCPLVGGIPMMLYFSKIHAFGMLTITGVICGLFMMLTGMGPWVLATGTVFGLLADLVLKSGGYADAKRAVIAHGVFSMFFIGNYIPMFLGGVAYYDQLAAGYGQEYAQTVMGFLPSWMFIVLLAAGFVAGVVGALIGRAIFKKHFERAGIA